MSHWRISGSMTVMTPHVRTLRTAHEFKEIYKEAFDAGYNACILELRQIIGPERGSIDTVFQHLESCVQQKNRGSALKSNTPASL